MPEFIIDFGMSHLTAKNVTDALTVPLMLMSPMHWRLSVTVPLSARTYLSGGIGSVKLIQMSAMCTCCSGDIDQGMYLEAYTGLNATGIKLGRLLYGHVKNWRPNNSIWNRVCCQYPWVVTIGQVPAYPGLQTCYGGPHTHFSIKGEPGVGVSRMSTKDCGNTVYAGQTPIYWWTY
jgi:hypothetical protein